MWVASAVIGMKSGQVMSRSLKAAIFGKEWRDRRVVGDRANDNYVHGRFAQEMDFRDGTIH
jgi:hypothetical protein